MVSSADYQTNFNLMIASGTLADLIYVGASYYAEGVDAAIDDGYFLDLTDLVDEYMPNYQKVRTSDIQYELLSTTDSGRLGAVYELRQSKQGPWLGLWIRQDWLDDLGLDTPVTFDDYHEVLTLSLIHIWMPGRISRSRPGFFLRPAAGRRAHPDETVTLVLPSS